MQYKPLYIIVGLIALVSVVNAWGSGGIEWMIFMQSFMAGFFFVFAGFKMLDLKGFAKGFAKYDLLAMQWQFYGLLYPFIEIALGVGYLLMPTDVRLNLITAVLMIFGGIGVSLKLARGEKFQCACLGTFINVPLTYITLVEDFGMAVMALAMLSI